MLYAAKCHWPGVTGSDLELAADRAAGAGLAWGSGTVIYLGSLLWAADDLVLCLSHAPAGRRSSRPATGSASPCERLMDSAWLGPHRRGPEGTQK